MTDKDLFGHGPKGGARHTDPDTSHIAAELVPVNKLELMFMKALLPNRVLTTTEIAVIYQMDRDSFSPRSRPLMAKGLIEQAGVRSCQNSAGRWRNMIAFRLTALGRARFGLS